MARSFNISAIFSAVDKLTQPVKQMSRQISQFASVTKSASQAANSAFNSTGNAAQSAGNKIKNAFNSINFNKLQFQLKNIQGHMKDFASMGAKVSAGLAVTGYAANKSLNPVRDYESARNALSVAFTAKDDKMTMADRMKVGEKQYQDTADMASKLPGSVVDIAQFRALLESEGAKSSQQFIQGFTDGLPRLGKSVLDNEYMNAVQSTLMGNQSDLMEKLKLKSFTDDKKGKGLRDLFTGQEHFFKNNADKLAYISQFIAKHYKGGTELAMASTGGVESNFGDATDSGFVKVWKDSGGLKLYTDLVKEFTGIVTKLATTITPFVKTFVDFISRHKELAYSIVIAIPAVTALVTGFVALSHALIPIILITKVLGVSLAGVGALAGGLALGIGVIAAMGGALAALYIYWDDLKQLLSDEIWTQWIERWKQTVSETLSGAASLGSNLVDYIRNGISNKWAELTGWFSGKIQSLLSIIPGIGGDFAASITTSPSMKPPSSITNLGNNSSGLAKAGSILSNSSPAVNVNINQVHNVAPNGQVSSTSQVTSNGAKPNVTSNTGQARRTSK